MLCGYQTTVESRQMILKLARLASVDKYEVVVSPSWIKQIKMEKAANDVATRTMDTMSTVLQQ